MLLHRAVCLRSSRSSSQTCPLQRRWFFLVWVLSLPTCDISEMNRGWDAEISARLENKLRTTGDLSRTNRFSARRGLKRLNVGTPATNLTTLRHALQSRSLLSAPCGHRERGGEGRRTERVTRKCPFLCAKETADGNLLHGSGDQTGVYTGTSEGWGGGVSGEMGGSFKREGMCIPVTNSC